jgi:hypothetical protein
MPQSWRASGYGLSVSKSAHTSFFGRRRYRPSVTAATAMLAYAPRIGLSRSALISSVVGSRPSRRAAWLWFLLGLPSIPPVWRSGCSFALGALLHLALQQMPRLRTGRGTHGRYAFRVSAMLLRCPFDQLVEEPDRGAIEMHHAIAWRCSL